MIETQVLDVARLGAVLDEVQRWEPGSHLWGHYAEDGPGGPIVCRTENLSPCVGLVSDLVDGVLADVASAYLGEPVRAFKDKVNYKQPGGAGFALHQDLPAYPGVQRVISILLAVDDADEESGCLWIGEPTTEPLPTDDRGVITSAVATVKAPLRRGDALVIDGLAPHYSERNRSANARRVLVASYAPASEGYSREQYYGARRDVMAAATDRDGLERISTLADFEGSYVAPRETASVACTHPPCERVVGPVTPIT